MNLSIKSNLLYASDCQRRWQEATEWLLRNETTLLAAFPDEFLKEISISCGSITFYKPSREDTVKLIKMFPGKWKKSNSYTDDPAIDYTIQLTPNLTLRAAWVNPPAACKIVEESIWVEPTTGSYKTIKKLVCR
jgi:hypothetical protein